MAGPLDGIRVIDWTIWQQGPVASTMLGDLGADIIKVEDKVGDPARGLVRLAGSAMAFKGRNSYFENNNRNKKSISIDLKTKEGKEIIYRLSKKSDVFVQNFRQGVAAKLGIDYGTLSKHNPMLVYANASGFGPKGPSSGDPSFDLVGQARGGLMQCSSDPDVPPQLLRGGLADQMGAIMLAYGVLAALVARERLGIGQEIDSSQLGSLIALQGLNMAQVLTLGEEQAHRRRTEAGNPLTNHYKCADGWIGLAMLQPDRYWPDFCRVMEIENLEKDPRFNTMDSRAKNCREIISALDAIFVTKTKAEWMSKFKAGGDFVVGPVNRLSEVAQDPQALANEYVTDFDHPAFGPTRVVGVPVQFSKTPGGIRMPAPELGQHTEEVLVDYCGYSWDDISELRDKEVI